MIGGFYRTLTSSESHRTPMVNNQQMLEKYKPSSESLQLIVASGFEHGSQYSHHQLLVILYQILRYGIRA